MSDLAATNCGCGCEGVSSNSCNNSGCGFGNNWILWIIILLSCCGNNGCGNGCGFGGDNCCIIIVLLLQFSHHAIKVKIKKIHVQFALCHLRMAVAPPTSVQW